MVQKHYKLPSLKMLATFECAARRGSFKAAATELNVTTSAISHQIKALEQDLGICLFERGHRMVQLTPEGTELMETLMASFSELSGVISRLRARYEAPHLTIGSTTAVSTLWLTPRVTQFWREHGDITISQNVRDRPFVRPLQPDLAIEYTVYPPKEESIKLFGDILLPLCSPDFERKRPEALVDLAQSPLIHLDASETNWTSWSNWFKSLGYSGFVATRQSVNNYMIALQVAQDGVGIVLGWKRLVQPLLESGKLVPYSKFESPAPGSFYLVFKGGVQARTEVKSFSTWLMDQVE